MHCVVSGMMLPPHLIIQQHWRRLAPWFFFFFFFFAPSLLVSGFSSFLWALDMGGIFSPVLMFYARSQPGAGEALGFSSRRDEELAEAMQNVDGATTQSSLAY
jgi:hypothetical protein